MKAFPIRRVHLILGIVEATHQLVDDGRSFLTR